MNKEEYFKMKEISAKIELYLALVKFCNEVSNHEPCLNYKKCYECSIAEKKESLKKEIMKSY